jgi:hypothetical protein
MKVVQQPRAMPVPVHIAIQIAIPEPKKAFSPPCFMWIPQHEIISHAQFLADVMGREVRITSPVIPDPRIVDALPGKYFTPKLMII